MSNGQQFTEFLSKHLVAFEYRYRSFNNGELFHTGKNVISGFIIEFHDRWFFVTAGHCFRDLDKLIRDGDIVIDGVGLADFYNSDATNFMNVPYWYEPESAWLVEEPRVGLDFAILPPLPALISVGLHANGIRPITRENWVHQDEVTFHHFRVLGFPVEDIGGNLRRAMLVPIVRIDPATIDDVSSNWWFAGRIHPDLDSQPIDMDRMSGGPIFGFRIEDGQMLYHVVGLQSRWKKSDRIILGCSMLSFAEHAHEILGEFFNEDEGTTMPE